MVAGLVVRKITAMQEKWVSIIVLPSKRKKSLAPKVQSPEPGYQLCSYIGAGDFYLPKVSTVELESVSGQWQHTLLPVNPWEKAESKERYPDMRAL